MRELGSSCLVIPAQATLASIAEHVVTSLKRVGITARTGIAGIDLPNCEYTVVVGQADDSKLYSEVRRVATSTRALVLDTQSRSIQIETAAHLVAAGAVDIISEQPGRLDETICRLRRWQAVDRLMADPRVVNRVVGSSQPLVALLKAVVEIAHFTNDSVLLAGASGTGKELLARLVHDLDNRSNKGNYIILDCTTIVPELSGSEFFGHERGAFTGAFASRDGAFALADSGTLFLDEVGELPLPLQAQLLRVIQEGTFRRVGSNVWQTTKFRLICATNRDLPREIVAGRFRRDLYYRIAQWQFSLPTLDERRDDILPLASYFLNETPPTDEHPLIFDSVVADHLQHRSYPGNIRELRLLVSRMHLLHKKSGTITVGCLPPDELIMLSKRFDKTNHPREGGKGNGHSSSAEPVTKDEWSRIRLGQIRELMREEVQQVPESARRRAIVLRRVAARLDCSIRWMQKCEKRYGLYRSLLTEINPGS